MTDHTTPNYNDIESNTMEYDNEALPEQSIIGNTTDVVVKTNASDESATGMSSTNVNDETTSNSTMSEEMKGANNKPWYCSIKLYVGLLLLGFIVFVIVDSLTNGYVGDAVKDFLDWIEENPISGCFLFVFVYMLATVLFIPGSILTLGAGFVFSMAFGLGGGVVLGTVSVFIGASLGAIIAFLLGRYLLQDQVKKLSNKYAIFEALNLALEHNGLKIFLLLRLSPIIPFAALNYLSGALSVSLRDYVLALFAIIPGTTLYVFLGASAGSLTDSMSSGQDPTITIIVVVVGIVFGVVAIYLTTRYARKELNRVIEQRRAEEGMSVPAASSDNTPNPDTSVAVSASNPMSSGSLVWPQDV